MNFLSPGVIAGVLALFAAVAGAFGYSALGTFFTDPNTATTVNQVLVGLGALVAGFLTGVKK